MKVIEFQPKGVAEMVDFLERTLEKAKAGELQAVFLAGVLRDGACYTGFVPNGRLFELIGAADSGKFSSDDPTRRNPVGPAGAGVRNCNTA